jgi:hypothetical protein
MKNIRFQKLLLAIIAFTVSVFFALNLLAQDSSAETSSPKVAPAANAGQTAPQVSYGMSQVLQLAHAKIGDSTIIAYIKNSGRVYSLDASQIVYLKQQGLSDAVIAAMINQRSSATAAEMQNTAPSNSTNANGGQTAAVVAPPASTYSSSTVYVVPDTQRYYYSPYYYPYYGYYWWPYPVVSFSFGYGGGYGGGYHGGYHGGGGHHH